MVYYGIDKATQCKCIIVHIPKMVKDYSFKKVGVDVGDQKLRSQLSYGDTIRSKGWSRKWGMHGVQQIRHNSFMCWSDIHDLKDGTEETAVKWSVDGCGGGKLQWAFQIGLIKGLLAHIRQFKRAHELTVDNNRKQRFDEEEDLKKVHTIVNRGEAYKNVTCAVCLHLKKTETTRPTRNSRNPNFKLQKSKYWCPHEDCRAHACPDHRGDIHIYASNGINLSSYHNMQRIEFTRNHPGRHKKPRNSGRQ